MNRTFLLWKEADISNVGAHHGISLLNSSLEGATLNALYSFICGLHALHFTFITWRVHHAAAQSVPLSACFQVCDGC
jgi:hypothetical protein